MPTDGTGRRTRRPGWPPSTDFRPCHRYTRGVRLPTSTIRKTGPTTVSYWPIDSTIRWVTWRCFSRLSLAWVLHGTRQHNSTSSTWSTSLKSVMELKDSWNDEWTRWGFYCRCTKLRPSKWRRNTTEDFATNWHLMAPVWQWPLFIGSWMIFGKHHRGPRLVTL